VEAEKLKPAIEAILFACGTPAELTKIAQALEIKEEKAEELLKSLMEDYSSRKSGIKIVRLGKSYQMCTEKEYAEIIRTVLDLRRNSPLSQAALEVLAIIAYNQPVTKAFVEQIRGVDCSGVVSSLVARELIEEKGRLELPGRPLIYGTTENFLRCFNVSDVSELPPLPQKNSDEENSEESSENGENENTEKELEKEEKI
jgi:segregation and condensation protein B